MITFENGIDIRSREVKKPTVARFRMRADSDEYRFVIIGTQYGHIHTSCGEVRTWRSASGAYRFIRNYAPF